MQAENVGDRSFTIQGFLTRKGKNQKTVYQATLETEKARKIKPPIKTVAAIPRKI
jgi:hypothetical protein